MKVRILSTNTTLTGVEGSIIKYNGCLPIWDGISQKIQITDLPTSNLKWASIGLQMTYPLPYSLYLEPVEGMILDLSSIFHPISPKYQDKLDIYNVMVGVAYTVSGTTKFQDVYIPIVNMSAPNLTSRIGRACTDFDDDKGMRPGIMHTLDDAFWFDSRDYNMNYLVDAIYRDGNPDTFNLSQGMTIGDACQYKKITVKKTDGTVVAVKFYPEEINLCGAVTLKWLNSTGSYDAISCTNWTLQPTISQGLDGGDVTKREISCTFEVTEANKFALDRLSVSPDTSIIGIPGTGNWIKTRCSSTTGVKMTASGLVKTVTLKFQY